MVNSSNSETDSEIEFVEEHEEVCENTCNQEENDDLRSSINLAHTSDNDEEELRWVSQSCPDKDARLPKNQHEHMDNTDSVSLLTSRCAASTSCSSNNVLSVISDSDAHSLQSFGRTQKSHNAVLLALFKKHNFSRSAKSNVLKVF